MDIKSRLNDASLLVEQAYIGGEWISAASGKTIAVVNPATGTAIANVPALGAGETRQAIVAAERAWPGLADARRGRAGGNARAIA